MFNQIKLFQSKLDCGKFENQMLYSNEVPPYISKSGSNRGVNKVWVKYRPFLDTTITSTITLDFGSIKTIRTINEENNIEISFNFNFKMVLDLFLYPSFHPVYRPGRSAVT